MKDFGSLKNIYKEELDVENHTDLIDYNILNVPSIIQTNTYIR